jgi:hypothetical protein
VVHQLYSILYIFSKLEPLVIRSAYILFMLLSTRNEIPVIIFSDSCYSSYELRVTSYETAFAGAHFQGSAIYAATNEQRTNTYAT